MTKGSEQKMVYTWWYTLLCKCEGFIVHCPRMCHLPSSSASCERQK